MLLLLGAGLAAANAKPFVSDVTLPGTGSERASALMTEKFPPENRDMAMIAQAQVVVEAPPPEPRSTNPRTSSASIR